MSLTGIIRNAFIPRQHKLERHFTEPEALQHDVELKPWFFSQPTPPAAAGGPPTDVQGPAANSDEPTTKREPTIGEQPADQSDKPADTPAS